MNRRNFLKNSVGLFVPAVFGIISAKADVLFRPWYANVPASTASYLYQQDFESGVNSAPSGWAQGAGTVTWNYATAPAPLAGSFSMETAAAARADLTLATVGAGSKTTLYYYFLFNAANKDDSLVSFLDTAGDDFSLGQNSTGSNIQMRIRANAGTFGNTVATYTASTTIHTWIAVIINGASSTIECWWSTTATKPATGGNNYAISGVGTTSGTFNTVQFSSAAAVGIQVYDTLRISSTPIGSNPS